MKKKYLLVLALVLSGTLSVYAQAPPLKEDPEVKAALALLEAQLAAQMQDDLVPGMSVAVIYDQDILWAKGFGYADVEKKIPADPHTIYRVGSITKLFTATMLMQLRDLGKLRLDDPLANYLPGFHIPSRFKHVPAVTLRQITSHTAGLPREAPLDYWETLEFPPIETILASLNDAEMTFPPWTEWKYSNLAVALMGYTLGLVAGQPYADYVRENILHPLAMNHSDFEITPAMKPHMATGYNRRKKKDDPLEVAPHPHIGGMVPAGQLYSSVEDIARFISLQFRDEPAGGSQILRGSTLKEMRLVQWMNPDWKSAWGIGWGMRLLEGKLAIGHSGGIHGFTTNITLIPEIKLGVAIFTNTSANPGAYSAKALELLVPVIARVQARRQRVEPKPPPAIWQNYVGLYSSDLGEVEIKIVRNQLVMVSPDTPEAPPVPLIPEVEHKFRMKGGMANGELLVFELDAAGNVKRLKAGPYPFNRK